MNNENIRWKTFKISDIFETVDNQVPTGAYINKSELKLGLIPRITVRDTNNGIDSYCESSNPNFRVYENFISVSFLGSVFYHPYKASLDMKVHALILKNQVLNRNLAEYFKVIIRANTYNFSYGNQLSSKDLAKLKIILPINEDEAPNYQYMENCMAEILDDKLNFVKKYCKENMLNIEYKSILKLSAKTWKAFDVNYIFTTIKRGKRLKKADHILGKVPYVSSTMMNNGVDNFIGNEKGKRFNNCITIANSGSVGASFYHQYEFIGSDHISALKNDKFNKFIYLFLTTIVSRIGDKYSFNREINDFRISKEKILLPVDKDGNPDYEYMEQYIKNVMFEQYSRYLQFLED